VFFKRKGFKIRFHGGRGGLTYIEGEKALSLDSEFLVGEPDGLIIWMQNARHWDPPHEREALSEADRERIKSRIAQHRKCAGIGIVWG